MTSKAVARHDAPGFTPRTLELERELANADPAISNHDLGDLTVEMRPGHDTVWCIVRRAGSGGIALRTVRNAGSISCTGRSTSKGGTWTIRGSSGVFDVRLQLLSPNLMRLTVDLTPADDLLVPFWSRDLYALDSKDNPRGARGWVEAAQRGVNTGLCYFCLDEPAFGSVLYLQDLTSLNGYFAAMKTKPDGVVGGEWPELGYQPPTAPMGNSPPINPLPAGERVTISDALVAFRETCSPDERASAGQFLEMLAEIYPHLTRPDLQFRDWMMRSRKTLRDLEKRPQSIIEHYGHAYLHPYTESEYPDSMVQMSVVATIREYEHAFGDKVALADDLFAGMDRFYDKTLGSIRRYLPNVGDDKNANAVDSWYLYHPLMNLGRLAMRNDAKAKALFFDSLDFGIKAARHFKYRWPIQYDVTNFDVITPSRNAQGLGQTDVGGLYAYVMLLAHDLTGAQRYVREAQAALEALREARFELVYQTNLSAWGVAACARLWRLTREQGALDQSFVFLAGLFHNSEMWDSQIEHARHYNNFFGVTCLHDAPYLAAYECFEAFAAIDEYLQLCGDNLPPHVRLLCAEFRRYSLDRGWYFYPDALPSEALAKDNIRNGYIDRNLSFPLEDLYGDGQPAGQVGQEIYGCGGAFIFAARAFLPLDADDRMLLFSEYPAALERSGPDAVEAQLRGPAGFETEIRIVARGRKLLPTISIVSDQTAVRGGGRNGMRTYRVAADARLHIRWRH